MDDDTQPNSHVLIPNHEEFNLDIITSFIEKHPEDADKWLEHLKPIFDPTPIPYGANPQPSEDEITKHYFEEEKDADVPPNDVGCTKCKKTWASTSEHPTTTLLCGHRYHTICYLMGQYYDDMGRCPVEGCSHSPWELVRKISRRRDRAREEARNILTEAVSNKEEFKRELRVYNDLVKEYVEAANKLKKMTDTVANNCIRKNVFSIRAIQDDINSSVKSVKESDTMKDAKKVLSKFRKYSQKFYRKYHLSLRDLLRRNMLRKMNWGHRAVLERHNNILSIRKYRMGIRIRPGNKTWSKYMDIDTDEVEPQNEYVDRNNESDIESHSETDSETDSYTE
jgi:hypothetical protein